MFKSMTYEELLFNLGWHQMSQKVWSKKTTDRYVIKIDFSNDEKGVFSAIDKNNNPISIEILNEFEEITVFRRLQHNLDSGVPI